MREDTAVPRRGKKELIIVGPTTTRQRVTWRTWVRLALAIACVGSLFFAAMRHDRRQTELRSARLEMEQIVTAARFFRHDFGRCPRSVDEMTFPPGGGTPYFARTLRDPWGRPYFLGCPSRWDERRVDVASPGPDGEWLGGDDISTDL
jgi:hypothetical protein